MPDIVKSGSRLTSTAGGAQKVQVQKKGRALRKHLSHHFLRIDFLTKSK